MKKLAVSCWLLSVSVTMATSARADAAAVGIEYIDACGRLQTNYTYEAVTSSTAKFTNGWYAVTNDVEITGHNITVDGSAHLILCDRATLKVTNVPEDSAAIEVTANGGVTNSLSIYAQASGTGGLDVSGGEYAAGIGDGFTCAGGGTVTINGGTVTAQGGYNGVGIGGRNSPDDAGCTVTINGGTVTARGGEYAAGIGVGGDSNAAGGIVTINGGTVTANGGCQAAGIGGGDQESGGTVTINGGTVMTQGGEGGAGIGGGYGGAGGTVAINGGTIEAQGGEWGAGIGGGYGGAGGTVAINGGTIEAQGDEWGAGIGRGVGGEDDGTVVLSDGVQIVFGGMGISYARVKVTDERLCAVRFPVVVGLSVRATVDGLEYAVSRTADGSNAVAVLKGEVLALTYSPVAKGIVMTGGPVIMTEPVQSDRVLSADILPKASGFQRIHYQKWTGEGFVDAECDAAVLSDADDALIDGYWYAVTNDVLIADTNIMVRGSANLVLCDGATLTVTNVPEDSAAIVVAANGGVTNSLSIYAQAAGTGGLDVSGGYHAAGIGGRSSGVDGITENCGVVTICGGRVVARGAESGAGIGGGDHGAGGTVTINGGTVTATGGEWGAGIGGGYDGAGGTVTVNGGRVTATGGGSGAGIGGGDSGAGGAITINGGAIEAQGGDDAAGIGGGYDGAGGTVAINGGMVTATGGGWGAGIGGGDSGAGGAITIKGGMVTATGGEWGAGIGGGDSGAGGAITINGGTIEAQGGDKAAGIGGGDSGAGGTVAINGGTVTAQGGEWGAGIGSGFSGSFDAVTITGGKVTAHGTDGGADIGQADDFEDSGTVAISGGLFWDGLQDKWIVAGYAKVRNIDTETKDDYPWTVVEPVPVKPGEQLGPYVTAEMATNMAKKAVLAPSPEVAKALGSDEALTTYRDMFTFGVVPAADDQWAVEAVLTPEAWTNVAESAQEATRQIPLSDIAAMTEEGKKDVTVEGCVPGFYYTLYGAQGLSALPMGDAPTTEATAYGPVLCEPDKPVTFEAVTKPSDAAGFFSIGARAVRE